MDVDSYIAQLTDISSAAQQRLSRASVEKRYWHIPTQVLLKLYEKYRNYNLNPPSSGFELVAMTFGFVELEIGQRMRSRYYSSLASPQSWAQTVDEFREEVAALESAIIGDMNREASRSQ